MVHTVQRSKEILSRPEFSLGRSLFKSMGYSDDDLDRPLIGLANSWSTALPGHANLRQVSDHVKQGIYRGGGTPVEFGVIGGCDGIAQGHEGMRYILPSREVICDSIEIMVEANRLDGLVLLASCDKIVPGMLMAAARLDIPAILVPGGPSLGGIEFDGRKSDTTSIPEARGMVQAGRVGEEQIEILEDYCMPTCGSCSFLGTANTMCCLSEAVGMTLPGGALIPAVYADRLRLARESGLQICRLVEENITARQILTAEALENAVRICMAIAGSTNAVLHLTALAYEAGAGIDILQAFKRLNRRVPHIARVNPAARWDMEDFWRAGGIPRVMKNMRSLLDTGVLTCTGETLGDNIEGYEFVFPEREEIIKTPRDPFGYLGGIAVLEGSLAPDTGVCKPGAIDPEMWKFTGRARVFDSEEEANRAILNREIEAGDVVVIRYEGPKGGPGMREMYYAMKYLYGLGLARKTALVTDGRFSGTNNGCFVGHISPEAAEGGPIAAVREGDRISIDVEAGSLELHVPARELEDRLREWSPPEPGRGRTGYLYTYSRLATSASEGAIIRNRPGEDGAG